MSVVGKELHLMHKLYFHENETLSFKYGEFQFKRKYSFISRKALIDISDIILNDLKEIIKAMFDFHEKSLNTKYMYFLTAICTLPHFRPGKAITCPKGLTSHNPVIKKHKKSCNKTCLHFYS